ncbi:MULTISPECIES: MFS transporter [unclassified Saccharibacter]|uniref:MFS transporter n=1 Tax=unclassified Saccharibacter TaxID=2648722 RepID=UPI00132677A7|nr:MULTISPECIES: MFS transporter [unclassified Saccharibacter]MXV36052.1 MFS transporter [Saccharibacter sp. EH611]MXV56911.1 MFS transporter [Saccharibacter sp. EH70]MXV66729.1 MFS transporter [Saccharibacter sp. EH60]
MPCDAQLMPPSFRSSRAQRWQAVFGSAVGYMMDGFDLLVMGFMIPVLSQDLHLLPVQTASLVTATLLGTVIGGVFFGALSDRLGRVRVLAWSILLFAVASGLSALAYGYWDLLCYRVITGIGLGGEFGIGMALVAESWPAAYRTRASSYVGLGWQLGVLAAALLTPLLLPLVGWRGLFALGAVPALVAYGFRNGMVEPVRNDNSSGEGTKAVLYAFFADKRRCCTTLGVFLICAIQNFGYYGVMIWLPNYLNSTLGYSTTRSGLWTAVTILGMIAGMMVFGYVADRIGQKRAFRFWMMGAAVMVVVYAMLHTPLTLLIGGAVMGFFVNGMIGGYGALISTLYPRAVRATAQTVLFNAGRMVGGFGPVIIGILAEHIGFSVTISLLACLYLVDMAALALIFLKGGEAEDMTAVNN